MADDAVHEHDAERDDGDTGHRDGGDGDRLLGRPGTHPGAHVAPAATEVEPVLDRVESVGELVPDGVEVAQTLDVAAAARALS